MSLCPERFCEINTHIIEEYYWAGGFPVYVDGCLTKFNYETCIALIENGQYTDLFE